jgi:transcriptional regulator with XRE-family HTH domain
MQVGKKIRDLRLRRSLTVQQLADACGLSKGFISQVENERTSPSLATLGDIARALGASAAYLVTEEDPTACVVRADQRVRLPVNGNTSRVEVLSATPKRNLDLILAEFPPGVAVGEKRHYHHGEECMLVLQGQVRVHLGDAVHDLSPGDAIHFDGRMPHAIENVGENVVRVLTAMTPAAFEPIVRAPVGTPERQRAPRAVRAAPGVAPGA